MAIDNKIEKKAAIAAEARFFKVVKFLTITRPQAIPKNNPSKVARLPVQVAKDSTITKAIAGPKKERRLNASISVTGGIANNPTLFPI